MSGHMNDARRYGLQFHHSFGERLELRDLDSVNREEVIGRDDVVDLVIALEASGSVEGFLRNECN